MQQKNAVVGPQTHVWQDLDWFRVYRLGLSVRSRRQFGLSELLGCSTAQRFSRGRWICLTGL